MPGMSSVNIFAEILERLRAASEALIAAGVLPPGIDQSRVTVEPPRDAAHGDMSTNAAMVLAKDAGRKPRELAETIAEKLRADALVAKAEVAGPGFVNITLRPAAWADTLRAAVRLGSGYGKIDIGNGAPVNVEYVSANPTGPMHVGHGRGAVFGDALANLLAFTGFKVTREYYINDAGAQVDALARSAFLRYREALGEKIGAIPEGLYPGDYLKPVGDAIAAEYGDALAKQSETSWLPIVRDRAVAMMMQTIRDDLAALDVKPDVFFSERSLLMSGEDRVGATIEFLRQRGDVYEGRLPPPKGVPAEDWEDREQTLFRSTAFGDDIDRPLKKSDGSYTYFASDIAYHRSKLERGFRTLIDVWGADHAGYIKRMQAAVAALSDRGAELDVKVVQLVKLLRAGQPVKMSKRAGEFVTLREVVDEVGRDPVRFMMLFRKNDAALDLDLVKVREQSRDNPVFYVQYGHARAQSVFRNARAAFTDLPDNIAQLVEHADLARLNDPVELALMRQVALYPRTLAGAAAAHEPHRIAFYLFDLASEFHALWTLGNASPHLRFIIQNDRQLTEARLVLVQGVAAVLASGLALLGVEAPNEMR
ncbi:MAG TPA: arginine--tRNA ligase [Xanthobacteraceae bacterium]|nr:arginine--tRNA ligase [Xanthobacteraceae bacterium]